MHLRTLLAILLTCSWLPVAGCGDEVVDEEDNLTEEEIEARIEQANYCTVASDCVDIGGKCPFGCYILVNVAEADEIEKLVDEYHSNCMYSCMAIAGIECTAGKCEVIPE